MSLARQRQEPSVVSRSTCDQKTWWEETVSVIPSKVPAAALHKYITFPKHIANNFIYILWNFDKKMLNSKYCTKKTSVRRNSVVICRIKLLLILNWFLKYISNTHNNSSVVIIINKSYPYTTSIPIKKIYISSHTYITSFYNNILCR